MDNYDLTNSPLLGDCADSGEYDPWLTAEQNTQVPFSGWSATVSTPEQAELQQPLLTDEEQLSEQRVLADFDISLASNIVDPLIVDEPVAGGPEDPFTVLAAYQPLTFDDNSQHPSGSQLVMGLDFLEGFTAKDLTVFIQVEPKGNDVFEQPEQSQRESDAAGIIIPESANPDTDTDKRSGKRLAPAPRDLVIGNLPESVINESSRRSDMLTGKRQKLDSTDTEFLLLPRWMATKSQAATMPEKSATFQKNTKRQDPDESLRKCVNEETNKYIVKRAGSGRRFMCSYPDCAFTSATLTNLRTHIFRHIHISIHKCPYPVCEYNPYFRNASSLTRHVRSYHKKEKPYYCTLCHGRYARLDSYKKHLRNKHKMSL